MMSNARHVKSFLLLAMAALALAGCTSAVDMLPEKLGGLPSDAPQRPATTLPSPNVYEVRPTREARPLSTAEQKKLESDLTALRESEKQRANPPPPPAPPPAKQAAAKDSGSKKAVSNPGPKGPAAPKKPTEPMKLSN
jgi:hypothetical protein